MSHELVLEHVEIHRGQDRLLAIDAVIAPGEILTLMGPSGSGKSTLINAISGFLPKGFACKGHITLDGADITRLPPDLRHVGVLFQDALLFPHFSVVENVIYALPRHYKGADRRPKAMSLLAAVGLDELADRDPATLSGGQQARVALMRVLAAEPKALLLDEPFSKLDMQLRDNVRQLVFEEIKRRQLPCLLVTHDSHDAEAAGGALVTLGKVT